MTVIIRPFSTRPTVGQTKWSDPNTWPNRKVPVAGDKVVILETFSEPSGGRGRRFNSSHPDQVSFGLTGLLPESVSANLAQPQQQHAVALYIT